MVLLTLSLGGVVGGEEETTGGGGTVAGFGSTDCAAVECLDPFITPPTPTDPLTGTCGGSSSESNIQTIAEIPAIRVENRDRKISVPGFNNTTGSGTLTATIAGGVFFVALAGGVCNWGDTSISSGILNYGGFGATGSDWTNVSSIQFETRITGTAPINCVIRFREAPSTDQNTAIFAFTEPVTTVDITSITRTAIKLFSLVGCDFVDGTTVEMAPWVLVP